MNVHKEYLQALLVHDSSDCDVIKEKGIRQEACDKKDSEKQRIERMFNRERMNLEPHQLVWCDSNINIMVNTESVVNLEGLRKIVDYTKLFDNLEEFQRYLTEATDSATFLVCSGELGEKIIPEIHQLGNVRSIYIYCRDKDHHQQWSSQSTKIKKIYLNLEELLKDLNQDVEGYLKDVKNNLFIEFGRKDETTGNWLTWWSNLIDVIIQLPYPDTCQQKLAFALKDYYQGKGFELRILEEFERDYTANKSIHWYTRDTFFYRLVNKALRQENIQFLFMVGFFIRDLHLQLNEEHVQFKARHRHDPVISVYRGQIMSLNEIQKLDRLLAKQSADITIKSFFSTSLDHTLALVLQNPSKDPSDEFHTVLMEIEIDVRMDCRPFADVSHLSQFSSENEILFTIGTQFRVVHISYDQGFYTIKLKLIDDFLYGENNFQHLSTHELLKECTDLLISTFPSASVEQIEECFTELINFFPSEKQWLKASKCQNLALRYQQDATDYRKAIFMYEKAIENWKQCMDNDQLNCAAQIGQMHREISEIYRRNIKDDSLADQHHELAMHFSKDALQKANSEKEMSKILDSLHTNKMDFTSDEVKRKDIGLETIRHLELSWQSFREQRPFLSSQILSYLLKIADTPHSIRQFEEALTIYHQILAVHNQQNEALDLSLYIDAYQQIVGIYIEHKEDYLTALNFQLMAHKLILKNNVIEADDDIEEIAWKNEKTSESHLTLTEIYIKLQQYNLAQENLYAARKIYQQIDIRKKEEKIAAIDEKLRSIQKFLPEEPVIYTE